MKNSNDLCRSSASMLPFAVAAMPSTPRSSAYAGLDMYFSKEIGSPAGARLVLIEYPCFRSVRFLAWQPRSSQLRLDFRGWKCESALSESLIFPLCEGRFERGCVARLARP